MSHLNKEQFEKDIKVIEDRIDRLSELTFREYQNRTRDTAIYGYSITNIINEEFGVIGLVEGSNTNSDSKTIKLLCLSYTALGLGEVGEIQGKVKKIIRDSSNGIITDDHRAALMKELGDVLWYVAAMCKELGLDMGVVAQYNIDKLMSRKERGVVKGEGDDR